MAKIVTCDLCGKDGAVAGLHARRVALPETFTRAKVAEVQIRVFLQDGRLSIPDICEACTVVLASAPAYVAPAPAAPTAPEPKKK